MNEFSDLFISYRRSQRAAVQAAVTSLEQAGIRCFLDTTDIDPLADFPEVLKDAIAHSKAVLVWWSADYTESEHCMAELTLGWQYARAHSSKVRQRLWVVNPEASPDHICAGELQSSNLLAADAFSDTTLIAQLRQRLADITTPLASEKQPTEPKPCKAACYGSQAQAISRHFTGRLRELWQLRSLLHPAKISQSQRLVAIQTHGMAGIGKTELARAYVDKFSAAYPGGVFWLNLAPLDSEAQVDNNSMRRVWADAVREALDWGSQSRFYRDSQGQYLEAQPLWEKLQQQGPWQGQPVLWLLDNVPVLNTQTYHQLQMWLTAPMANSHTLITTRFAGELSGFRPLSLKPLEGTTALRLLRSYRDFSAAEQPLAKQLVQQTGAHTLALVLAGEYLKHSSYQQLIDGVNTQQLLPAIEQIAALLKDDLGDKAAGIVATFALSLQRLNDSAKRLLALACQCEGNSAFPSAVLLNAAKALFQLDDMQSNIALRSLSQAGLVQQSEQLMRMTDGSTYNEPMLELHPLTISACSELLYQQLDLALPAPNELQHSLIAAVLPQFTKVSDNRTHAQLQPYLALAHFLSQQHASDKAISLRHQLGVYYFYAGQWQNANNIISENLQFFTEVLKLPSEHHVVLTSKNNLASTLKAQGDLAGARRLEEAVLEAREHTLGAEHPDTLTSKNNLAQTLLQQGELAGARVIHEEVLTKQVRLLGPDHPDTLCSKSNLALTLLAQGDLANALTLQEALAAASELTLGAEHQNTLNGKMNLAETLRAQGNLSKAKELGEQVLAAYERLLGTEHSYTLACKNNLVAILLDQGDLVTAKTVEVEVLKVLERTLGAEHPQTLFAKGNLANILWQLEDKTGAKVLEVSVLEVLERTLGAEHPKTLTCKNNLACTLMSQGDLAGARVLQEAMLPVQKRLLGDEHPDTLFSINNLAFTLLMQREMPQALSLFRQAYLGRCNQLGHLHPETIKTGEALLFTMLEMGLDAKKLFADLRDASGAD